MAAPSAEVTETVIGSGRGLPATADWLSPSTTVRLAGTGGGGSTIRPSLPHPFNTIVPNTAPTPANLDIRIVSFS
jgi:hypothetical protein